MPLLVTAIAVAAASYLIGAVPASFIMGKLVRGIDLREHGSGNLGAANTFRVLGPKAALPVLLFDIGKGFVAVWFLPGIGDGHIWLAMLAAVTVVLGHNYCIFLRFSGGKGVGTTAGAFVALGPLALTICMGIRIFMLLITRIVALASMVASLMLPVSITLTNVLFDSGTHHLVLALSCLVALLVIYKHRPNIRRLMEGTEKRIF